MIFAIFVQWGTAGSSILIAYLTPTISLGCRFRSYLLYSVLGTSSWLFLLSSILLSHAYMLCYQEAYKENPEIDFRRNRHRPENFNRSWGHTALCATAVIFRYIGKLVAVANTA